MTQEYYKIRKKNEWANIFVDEESGSFSAISSFGNYGYSWHSIGNQTLKEFLASIDRGYFMDKATGHNSMGFDFNLTMKSLRKEITEYRREEWITKDQARQARAALKALEPCQTTEGFMAQFVANYDLTDVWPDTCDMTRKSIKSDCVGFWKIIWPEFLKQISPRKQRG